MNLFSCAKCLRVFRKNKKTIWELDCGHFMCQKCTLKETKIKNTCNFLGCPFQINFKNLTKIDYHAINCLKMMLLDTICPTFDKGLWEYKDEFIIDSCSPYARFSHTTDRIN